MADLPEREQADTSFDTLYHLAKKLEADISRAMRPKWDLRPTIPIRASEVFYTGGTRSYGRTRLAPTRS